MTMGGNIKLALVTEIQKYFRSKIFLVLLLLVVFETLWVSAAIFISMGKETEITKTIAYPILQAGQIHALLMPFFIAVLASRIAVLEHDARAYKLVFTTRLQPVLLYIGKFFVLLTCVGVVTLCHVLALFLVASTNGVVGEKWNLLLVYALGIFVAGISVSALQLFFAMRYERQQVALLLGGVGALLGVSAKFVPLGIAIVLPWQYFGLMTPVTAVFKDNKFQELNFPENFYLTMVLIAAVGIILIPVAAKLFERKILE